MYNILISGVGGQGTLLASRILGRLYLSAGWDVKVSEVHGMSQRGGSVITYVRAAAPEEPFGVGSPIIPNGEADLLLAFEELEALRWAGCVKKTGAIAVNTQEIPPMPVITGAAEYPQGILSAIEEKAARVMKLDALSLAVEAGSSKAANVVLLGAVSTAMDFSEEQWLEALEQTVKPKFLEMNKKAFALGRSAAKAR